MTKMRNVGGRLSITAALMAAVLAGASIASQTLAATLAFYAPWDSQSAISMQAHTGRIDVLAPAWISVAGTDDNIQSADDAAARTALNRPRRRPTLLPVIQNARDGDWHGADAAALLASPARRKVLLDRLEPDIAASGGSGMVFDFEDLPSRAQPSYLSLLAEAHARFAPRHWRVAVSVPANDSDWDLGAYGRAADLVILMAYDEHWPSSAPGPIASPAWFATAVRQAAAQIPAPKLAVGLASYGYDWPAGGVAKPLSVSEAKALAAKVGATPTRSAPGAEPHFGYTARSVRHQVWFVDAQANRAQADLAQSLGVNTLALWRLGSEDPDLWRWFGGPGQ